MKVVKGYDEKIIGKICRHCKSENVKKTFSYLRIINYHKSKDIFLVEIIDDVAMFAGVKTKKYFRLIEFAVHEDYQCKGYGTALMIRLKKACKENNLNKITLRTSQNETAVNFFKKNGGIIVGTKGNDYEMEINL